MAVDPGSSPSSKRFLQAEMVEKFADYPRCTGEYRCSIAKRCNLGDDTRHELPAELSAARRRTIETHLHNE